MKILYKQLYGLVYKVQKESCVFVEIMLLSKQSNLVSHWDTFVSVDQIIHLVLGMTPLCINNSPTPFRHEFYEILAILSRYSIPLFQESVS